MCALRCCTFGGMYGNNLSVLWSPVTLAEAGSCGHLSLLDRLDDQLAICLGAQLHRAPLEEVSELVAANELDRQRRPLALVAFSNSTRALEGLAGAFATALFGDARDGVRVLDLAALLPSVVVASTNYDVKQTLRAALADVLTACPKRSLVVVQNVQALDDTTLPVLDTFLDPLNGERAQLQVHGSGAVLDAASAVFLFLFKSERAAFEAAAASGGRKATWRDFLMAAWTRREGLVEEFTPQAFVGRLTAGVALFASDEEAGAATPLAPECRVLRRQALPTATDSDSGWGWTVWLVWGLVPAFALLYVTRRWTQEVAVKRARRGPIKPKKKAKRTGSSAKKARRKF
ncbi:hypothetical protein PybrP1_006941 [[Pythium] brassicae (nom. inval.)]|nr:hypothetical protein PybrP1_006941 [[Pythium] brassicae (nom. inval.)]